MKSTITKNVFTGEITTGSKEQGQYAKSKKMKKGHSYGQETECQQEDKVEVIERLESKKSKSGYETKSTFKVKEQWKGVDTFDIDEIKGGCVAGFPSGTLMFFCFD